MAGPEATTKGKKTRFPISFPWIPRVRGRPHLKNQLKERWRTRTLTFKRKIKRAPTAHGEQNERWIRGFLFVAFAF